jgi:phytoene dehydrogenase-like protein
MILIVTVGRVTGTRDVDALVIGAGFAGLRTLYTMRGLGMSVAVLAAGDGIGGVRYWNRYPGARCDVESYDYSFGFSEELQQEWRWSEPHATQPEILRYIEHVADLFDLRRDVHLRRRMTRAEFGGALAGRDRVRRPLVGSVPGDGRRQPVDGQGPRVPGPGRVRRPDPAHRALAA